MDASVALKWVIAESDSSQAELLLDHALVAPDLLFAECANALWKKVRRRELTAEEAEIAAQMLQQADLAVVSARGYIERATAISIELDHPVYDTLYVAIAEAFGLRLVTADGRLSQSGAGSKPLAGADAAALRTRKRLTLAVSRNAARPRP